MLIGVMGCEAVEIENGIILVFAVLSVNKFLDKSETILIDTSPTWIVSCQLLPWISRTVSSAYTKVEKFLRFNKH